MSDYSYLWTPFYETKWFAVVAQFLFYVLLQLLAVAWEKSRSSRWERWARSRGLKTQGEILNYCKAMFAPDRFSVRISNLFWYAGNAIYWPLALASAAGQFYLIFWSPAHDAVGMMWGLFAAMTFVQFLALVACWFHKALFGWFPGQPGRFWKGVIA